MSERKGTKALELWCKRLVKDCPNVHIDNMTTSWKNGIAFCALVHHFRPDLIDMSALNPENIYDNNRLAFNIAEKHLGIPALLDPEDMVESDVPDRLSILTYLSQFYQRLGHTVSTKANENDSTGSSPSSPASTSQSSALTFGKVGLDKCAACGLPVYLAQRLIVSHKLYHRQCYCCSKCLAQLNPGNMNTPGSELICDNCINDHPSPKYLPHDDAQMGMLAFTDSSDVLHEDEVKVPTPISETPKRKSQSILDKISMFEKNPEEDIDGKLDKLSINKVSDVRSKEDIELASGSKSIRNESLNVDISDPQKNDEEIIDKEIKTYLSRENSYKSDKKKFTFLQTQLATDEIKDDETSDTNAREIETSANAGHLQNEIIEEPNVTDDTRLANNGSQANNTLPENEVIHEASIVAPRRKKRVSIVKSLINQEIQVDTHKTAPTTTTDKVKKEYPDHLNPFSDDEEEEANPFTGNKRESTNPFGSSDDEDAPVANPPPQIAISQLNCDSAQKRLIAANPFWSDGEEPSSDDESHNGSHSSMYSSSIATSTPNLRVSTPRRKKAPAPPPPPPAPAAPPPAPPSIAATSTDDVASLCSMSSYSSTVHSDQKSVGKLTPRLKKRLAPTPPDSLSTLSALSEGSRDPPASPASPASPGPAGSELDRSDDLSGSWKHQKRPAPGLPLPARRTVRPALPPAQLQAQLELLEAQQAGLEKQGVRLEQLIREKCEGDAGGAPPPAQVEELVIQLCELVNEKNELFRKQTELMYIRRQQRLEQQQADVEHDIRVLQSRPAVNRIDADKAREEQLVARLVALVKLRDELVQQMESERRRERQEDRAIAASIASRRAQRSSCSTPEQPGPAAPHKKTKVKDKMKRQLKKAKHSLIPKKKDDSLKGTKEGQAEKNN